MTERRSFAAVWVLAPVTAGVLSVTTGWAIDHAPDVAAANAAPGTPQAIPAPGGVAGASTSISDESLRELARRVAIATRRYESARLTLLDVERRINANAHRLAALRIEARLPSATGTPARTLPAPIPAPAPSAPPVHTTTGAS